MNPSEGSLIEEGDPSRDSTAFRSCLGNYTTGVTIVAAEHNDRLSGMTANSFASLSLDPPLILWSIRRESSNFDTFANARYFSVSILGSDQFELAGIFAKSDPEKFSKVKWSKGRFGSPIIDGASSILQCELEAVHPGGDHVILVGRVLHFSNSRSKPLVFTQGRYGITAEHPGVLPKMPSASGQSVLDNPALTILLFRAYHTAIKKFEATRESEGFTLAEGRVLVSLYQNGQQTAESVARDMYLGARDAEEALASLIGRDLATLRPDGTFVLTAAGRSRREAVRARAAEFESAQLAGLSEQEIAAGKKLLHHLIDVNMQESGGLSKEDAAARR